MLIQTIVLLYVFLSKLHQLWHNITPLCAVERVIFLLYVIVSVIQLIYLLHQNKNDPKFEITNK